MDDRKIDRLMDKRKIDRLVAERVLGWTAPPEREEWVDGAGQYTGWDTHDDLHRLWAPSTDWRAAGVVVDAMSERGYFVSMLAFGHPPDGTDWEGPYEATFIPYDVAIVPGEGAFVHGYHDSDNWYGLTIMNAGAEANAMPLAICSAALRALGIEAPND